MLNISYRTKVKCAIKPYISMCLAFWCVTRFYSVVTGFYSEEVFLGACNEIKNVTGFYSDIKFCDRILQ